MPKKRPLESRLFRLPDTTWNALLKVRTFMGWQSQTEALICIVHAAAMVTRGETDPNLKEILTQLLGFSLNECRNLRLVRRRLTPPDCGPEVN